MLSRFKYHASKLKKRFFNNDLQENGERIEIIYDRHIDFEKLDLYQKSHYRRYEFSKKFITPNGICGDLACGTGYGSVMLSEIANKVIGVDIKPKVVTTIKKRYQSISNVEFFCANLLDIDYREFFNDIVSFETVEHFHAEEIADLFAVFNRALIPGGLLIFSTPYLQSRSLPALKMGFHHIFNINENTLQDWLSPSGFVIEIIKYQNYQSHFVADQLEQKDFLICLARKR